MATPGKGFAPGRHAIEAIGKGGFLFAGVGHVGSVLALPSSVQAWEATSCAGITVASLAPLFAESAHIDFLLIGTGERFEILSVDVRSALAEAGIRFEVMSTSSATQTYNILHDEGRRVAAALIAVQ